MDATEILEQLSGKDGDTIISELKSRHTLTPEQQGLYILQIMKEEGFTRHKEVADVLGVSRSFVSLRIKAAKEKYGDITISRTVGRPKHLSFELDEIHGDKVPLRLISKIGEIPNRELTKMLMTHIVSLNKDNREQFFNDIIRDVMETGKYTKEEAIDLLDQALSELKKEN